MSLDISIYTSFSASVKHFVYLFALLLDIFRILSLDDVSFHHYHTHMSDIKTAKTEISCKQGAGETEPKQTFVRIKLKDKEYRRLIETARERGCSTEELVARCVRRLLDS